jgi:hypothetical protein
LVTIISIYYICYIKVSEKMEKETYLGTPVYQLIQSLKEVHKKDIKTILQFRLCTICYKTFGYYIFICTTILEAGSDEKF